MATIHITRGTTSQGTFSEEEVREGLRTGRFIPDRSRLERRNGHLGAAFEVVRVRHRGAAAICARVDRCSGGSSACREHACAAERLALGEPARAAHVQRVRRNAANGFEPANRCFHRHAPGRRPDRSTYLCCDRGTFGLIVYFLITFFSNHSAFSWIGAIPWRISASWVLDGYSC